MKQKAKETEEEVFVNEAPTRKEQSVLSMLDDARRYADITLFCLRDIAVHLCGEDDMNKIDDCYKDVFSLASVFGTKQNNIRAEAKRVRDKLASLVYVSDLIRNRLE